MPCVVLLLPGLKTQRSLDAAAGIIAIKGSLRSSLHVHYPRSVEFCTADGCSLTESVIKPNTNTNLRYSVHINILYC